MDTSMYLISNIIFGFPLFVQTTDLGNSILIGNGDSLDNCSETAYPR